jgi:hypothetical protein
MGNDPTARFRALALEQPQRAIFFDKQPPITRCHRSSARCHRGASLSGDEGGFAGWVEKRLSMSRATAYNL